MVKGPFLAVYCVQQLHAIACPFSKHLQILYIFAQISKNILPFLTYFSLFSGKSHACPYFLEQALGNLLKVLVCLFLYFEPNQVILLWKVSKKNKKVQKPNILLSLLTLLEFCLHLKTLFVIFSSYRFQMKQINTHKILCVTISSETGSFTSWA